MVILRSQNKSPIFLWSKTWACPFNERMERFPLLMLYYNSIGTPIRCVSLEYSVWHNDGYAKIFETNIIIQLMAASYTDSEVHGGMKTDNTARQTKYLFHYVFRNGGFSWLSDETKLGSFHPWTNHGITVSRKQISGWSLAVTLQSPHVKSGGYDWACPYFFYNFFIFRFPIYIHIYIHNSYTMHSTEQREARLYRRREKNKKQTKNRKKQNKNYAISMCNVFKWLLNGYFISVRKPENKYYYIHDNNYECFKK